jgi:cytochrome c5
MSDTDDIFLKRFSMVIAILVLITFGILFIADQTATAPAPGVNPSRIALANDRTLPEAAVRTVLTEEDLVAEALVAAETTPVPVGDIDGAAVYASACQACHMAGAAGAPIPGSDPWNERAGKGLEALAYSAINGLNAMPAKGGRADLSDEEVTAAVEYMLAQ